MTTAQRIIKYFAIALAIAIIAGIIEAILGVVGVFSSDTSIGEVRRVTFEFKEDFDLPDEFGFRFDFLFKLCIQGGVRILFL